MIDYFVHYCTSVRTSPVQQVDICSSLDVATDSFCPESIVENSRSFSEFTYACFHGLHCSLLLAK